MKLGEILRGMINEKNVRRRRNFVWEEFKMMKILHDRNIKEI